MKAAEKLRDAGFTNFDTHTPFPIHGMDGAMGMKDSKLGWIVLVMAHHRPHHRHRPIITYMNGIDYPIIVGGKPAHLDPGSTCRCASS
jgi:hypothetical protein